MEEKKTVKEWFHDRATDAKNWARKHADILAGAAATVLGGALLYKAGELKGTRKELAAEAKSHGIDMAISKILSGGEDGAEVTDRDGHKWILKSEKVDE